MAASLTVLGALIVTLAIVLPWVEHFKLGPTGVEAQLREILLLDEHTDAIEAKVVPVVAEITPPEQRGEATERVRSAIRDADSDWGRARRALLESYLEKHPMPKIEAPGGLTDQLMRRWLAAPRALAEPCRLRAYFR